MQRNTLQRSVVLAAGLLAVQACGGSDASDDSTTKASADGSSDDEGGGSNPTTGPGSASNPTNPTTEDTTVIEPDTTSTTTADTTATTSSTTTTTDDPSAGSTAAETEHIDETTTTAPAATCDDGEKNQDESDVDCGGMVCGPCPDAGACAQNSDCANNSCINGVCADPSCSDGLKNGEESDVDCGAGCQPCADNMACIAPTDCVSDVCTEGLCIPANCGDGVQNGDESDVDCGGGTCDGCVGGGVCVVDDDCLSESCAGGVCEATECLVDADCAAFNGECTMGDCKTPGFTCQAVPIKEGMACDDGNLCVGSTTCSAGTCGGGTPVDCSALSDQCNAGACDPGTGQCVANPMPPDTSCFESTCTGNKLCDEGVCGDPDNKPFVFYEDFSDNSAGWTLGTEWAFGATKTSVCGSGSDPASDHTPTTDNQVAGVVLGGCYATTIHDDYCLTSPKIDTSAIPGTASLSYWRWLYSDYGPYAVNKIDVFDGNTNTWVNLFLTGGSPGISDNAWKFFTFDVTAYKHANFQARWCFKTASGVFTRPGWSIDDVTVGPNTCGP